MGCAKVKPIHLIYTRWHSRMMAVCDYWGMEVRPIESIIVDCPNHYSSGTFDPKKVTCKRCLKRPQYEEAMDKIDNPLFYWKDNV